MDADRKVAVVTGASQGIGAGLAAGFRKRGYRIVANSRTIGPAASEDVLTVAGDVADPDTARRIVDVAIAGFGRIDTLVNNAGLFLPKPFLDYTAADFASVVAVNLAGFFHVSQLAAAAMLRQGSGHIVTITTMLVGQPMTAVPAALAALTKGGIDAVTRSLAIEYAGRGIRVNAVSPGAIDTPMHRPEAHGFLATLHPLGRMGTIEEIVEAVMYLETAAFVTGETLHVDGGAHAGRW
ncbi:MULTISPECIES: SDR family NAD(P)-dependent oxidoreductase [unclassified Inquilinus]|uniref:SDR family NAD(P)-dependent oxidoreductase n=1 Tax=unclassified Inquilinus TaxID=2645927 RepID=UPI003F910CC5